VLHDDWKAELEAYLAEVQGKVIAAMPQMDEEGRELEPEDEPRPVGPLVDAYGLRILIDDIARDTGILRHRVAGVIQSLTRLGYRLP
jgi:hypothetical protein